MADLHEALKTLAPIDWEDVPKDVLEEYVRDVLTASELICNSIPTSANEPASEQSTAQPAKAATTAAETGPSSARAPAPHADHEPLQSSWGKPIKFSRKENPLAVSMYKMAGKDRHGAWFARRSMHDGIGFDKFRTAMLREFPETLLTQGAPGAGSIRGIGGDQRLERIDAGKDSKMEVYQLSAQFPGPVTPREFITLLITNETPTTYSTKDQGRQLMIVSKPVSHPSAPDRPGHIRGQYESVELIREAPMSGHLSQSTPALGSSAADEKSGQVSLQRSTTELKLSNSSHASDSQAELRPVEWIMVTRSDPGGGIPRFMVERGTPSAMLGDMTKFLNWAVNIDANEDPNVDLNRQEDATPSAKHIDEPPQYSVATEPSQSHTEREAGVFAQLTTALEASLDAYAPAMVSSFIHDRLHGHVSASSSDDISDVSSTASFASAADVHDETSIRSDTTSLQSGLKKDGTSSGTGRDQRHDKEMQKIQDAQDKLEQKLSKKRDEESDKLKKSQEDEQNESSKALERHNKEMKKQEERHQKEMDKLAAKREREIKKFEDKKRKQNDRDAMQKVTRERDEFRTQVDLLKKENALLRERIESLENVNPAA